MRTEFDREKIMRSAWIDAEVSAFIFGGNIKDYIKETLKEAWKKAKENNK